MKPRKSPRRAQEGPTWPGAVLTLLGVVFLASVAASVIEALKTPGGAAPAAGVPPGGGMPG
jgi:hypothetical protein